MWGRAVQSRSEKQLLKRIRAGRSAACEQFVQENYATVYRFLLYLTQDVSLAEDLTQETFASAWRKIGEFDGKARLGTWLHQIAYRKVVDFWRSRRRHAVVATYLALHHDELVQADPATQLAAAERARQLSDAVRGLEDAERLLIVLHYFQALSFQEMADVLDEPVGTVKWRTSRALARLKELLMAKNNHEDAAGTTKRMDDVRLAGGGA
jgi:RNA polymerase sigma-70 factor (ECF subfamily)